MRMPSSVVVMTQRIPIRTAPNLHVPSPANAEGETHGHRAYGVYSEAEQAITLDQGLHFERKRETFLHENLHALLAVSQLDALIEASEPGFGEHLVATLAPVLLAWMRDNPAAVRWLRETQEVPA